MHSGSVHTVYVPVCIQYLGELIESATAHCNGLEAKSSKLQRGASLPRLFELCAIYSVQCTV